VCLALTPSLFALIDGIGGGPGGTIPPGGTFSTSLVLPSAAALYGTAIYSQVAVLDPAAPAGVAISNPRSLLFNLPNNFVPSLGTLSGFGTALHESTAFGGGRYVLVSGGGTGTLLAPTPSPVTEVYDSYTHTFLPGPMMSRARVLHVATLLPNGRVLITGGVDASAATNWDDGEIYDPATNTLSPVGNLMQGPRAAHTATLLNDGRVLICGGNTIFAVQATGNYIQIFQSAQSSTELYDPVTNLFTPGPSMSSARVGHSAVKLPDGRVLIAGGIRTGVTIGPLALPTYAAGGEVFDPATNTFSPTGSLGTPRFIGAMERLPSGNVLYMGGAAGILLSTTTSCEYLDLASLTWTTIPQGLPQGVALAPSATLGDGSIVVVGGSTGSAASATAVDQVVRFQESTFTWTTTAPLPLALADETLTQLPDGSFLVAGGADVTSAPQTQAFVWVP
jgi:hypothetical protein